MVIAWIVCLVICEVLSVCISIASKRMGIKNWALCFIPFAFPFFAQKIAKRFSVMTIPMKKYGKTIIILLTIAFLASFAYVAGGNAIDAQNPTDLNKTAMHCFRQIMILPVSVSAFIFYLSIVKSTIASAERFGLRFKGDVLLYLLIVPCAYVYLRVSPDREIDLY